MTGSQEYSYSNRHLNGNGNVSYTGRFGGVRRSRTKLKFRPNVTPFRELSDCKNFILERSQSALDGGYDDKRSFLNQLDCLIRETLPDSLNDPSFFEELCLLLLEMLRDDRQAVRAMCFHLLRLSLFTERNLVFLLTNHVDIYAVRALDLRVENGMERAEALQLIYHIMTVYQNSHLKRLIQFSAAQQDGKKYAFPKSIMQPIIAVALSTICSAKIRDPSGPQERVAVDLTKDSLDLGCLEVFLEFCVLEPELILDMAGTDWIVRILTGSNSISPRVATVVSRILVAWLDQPKLRLKGQLHLVLEQIFAPLIEFGFFQKNLSATEHGERIVECAMISFGHSFLCILRSWSGLLSCAAIGPTSSAIASAPLRLLEYLGLGTVDDSNLLRIRNMVVDICCEFLDLPYASKNFENWDSALEYYSSLVVPDEFSDSLKDDFVLAQSDMCIANNEECSQHVDLLASFRSLAALILINAGLLQSLARLITSQPDSPSGIKATLFVADMIRMTPTVMPSSWRTTILSMPTLFQSACESIAQSKAAAATHGYYDSNQADRFTFLYSGNAAMVLHRFDMLYKASISNAVAEPPIDSNYSLFLCPPEPLTSPFKSSLDTSLPSILNEVSSGDGSEINWGAAALLFSRLPAEVKEIEKPFCLDDVLDLFEKILTVMSPRSSAHTFWNADKFPLVVARIAITIGLELGSTEDKFLQALTRYATDVCDALNEISSGSDVFSTRNLVDGGSMYYFSLIGVMSSHANGVVPLEKSGILQQFVDLMVPSTSAAYVKVIVSCLEYEHDYCYLSKVILQKALTSTCESARRWCTRFLSVLAYRRLPNFGEWGFRLLLGQLGDQSVKVVRHAIRILHMWIPFYKDAARWLRTAQLDNFGEAGTLLKVHVYADEQSCEFDEAGTREAVELWLDSFGVRYVEAIDDNMRDALLSVRRSLSGTFSRTSGDRPQNVTFPTPAHLFYSLSCHEFGRSLLCGMKVIETLLSSFSEEEDPMKVKAALMGLGHIGSHTEGFKLLPSPVVPQMVRIAEEFPVLSVRGYAFWALNLLSASLSGAAALARLGWESNRHRETLDYMLKKGDDDADTQPIPSPFSSNPQIIIRSPRSRSGSENRAQFSSRQRSSSAEMSKSTESTPRIASSLPRVRRTRSATDVCPGFDQKKVLRRESDDVQPRYERAVTGDSVFTSGLGSLSEDSTEVGRRQTAGLDSLIGEWESRSRTSTIAYCLHQGLIADKSHLAMQGTVADMVRDPHHSNAAREKWRLAPLKTKRTLEVNRNLADPAVYVYMTNDEELSLSRYRREVLGDPWLHDELLRREMEPTPSIQTSHMSHVIALPSEVNVICSNIFPSRYAVSAMDLIVSVFSPDATDELEDRGARSGHGRSQRSDASITHSAYRCFYCSSKEKSDFVLPQEDIAGLRQEVLNQVDMLEIQQTTPEKKLLMLRKLHPWLFEWPCLYADVLELLDEYRFKSKSRAFLQEIFYNALRI